MNNGIRWVDAKHWLPKPIDIGDGTYCCNPEDSVICAIWRKADDGQMRLLAWAKQRYCADGLWRNNNDIGFVPTHWVSLVSTFDCQPTGKGQL